LDWEPYDPSWLVQWLADSRPDDPLIEALSECTTALPEDSSRRYLRFVDPANANEQGAPWQWERDELLRDTPQGNVLLVVLTGGRVGGLEFVDAPVPNKRITLAP
jgi:hypothetical protein